MPYNAGCTDGSDPNKLEAILDMEGFIDEVESDETLVSLYQQNPLVERFLEHIAHSRWSSALKAYNRIKNKIGSNPAVRAKLMSLLVKYDCDENFVNDLSLL